MLLFTSFKGTSNDTLATGFFEVSFSVPDYCSGIKTDPLTQLNDVQCNLY